MRAPIRKRSCAMDRSTSARHRRRLAAAEGDLNDGRNLLTYRAAESGAGIPAAGSLKVAVVALRYVTQRVPIRVEMRVDEAAAVALEGINASNQPGP